MNKTGTDLIKHLGELAFATRLKRLSDSLQADVAKVYRAMDIDFEPKWFTMLYALHHNGSMSVIELATLLKLSHPAIIQFGEQMEKQRLVGFQKDKKDARKKLLSLTDKGKETFRKIEPVLKEIETANRDFLRETGTDVLGTIERMERLLETKSMYRRVNDRLNESFRRETEILTYEPRFKKDFRALNEEWLKKYFTVEETDEKILANPQKEILTPNGEIFFAKWKNQVVGTVAVKRTAPKTFELLKMAVTEKFQSRGVGRMLVQQAIDFARKQKATVLELDTARKLEGAVKLYESMGFKITDENPSEKYQRCTIKMRLELKAVLFALLMLLGGGAAFQLYSAIHSEHFGNGSLTYFMLKMLEHVNNFTETVTFFQ